MKTHGSNLGGIEDYPECSFSLFYSVSANEFQDNASKQTIAAFFHICNNS
jgi:hypothetical protein